MSQSKSRYLTLMLVPETSGAEVRRFRVARSWIAIAIGSVLCLGAATAAASVLAIRARSAAAEGRRLAGENAEMRSSLLDLEARIARADQAVARLSVLEKKIRAMTAVSDPIRSIAMGPVGGGREEREAPSRSLGSNPFANQVDGGADAIGRRAASVEAGADAAAAAADDLVSLLERQSSRLASTPSRRPTRGYMSSVFGMRVDPFTGLPQRHAGLDFSAPIGAEVRATADGVVRSAGRHGAFGNLVEIDHGHGLTTRYAHLSKVVVRAGARVRRGAQVGEVGNSGRSTGPHLHYEVLLHGVPRDPRGFILE